MACPACRPRDRRRDRQALVLTAIVISFGMTAFLLALAVRAHADRGDDHVDGTQDAP
jgi:multicomponent K+:H+ antiporter subunit C